jgi:hypothetical protein
MDAIALSLKMKRLVRWLDDRCQPDNVVRRQYDGPPFGRCYLTIDPERQGEVVDQSQPGLSLRNRSRTGCG